MNRMARITRLENAVAGMQSAAECPACGMVRVSQIEVMADGTERPVNPESHPYGADGRCRRCGRPPAMQFMLYPHHEAPRGPEGEPK